MRKQKICGIYKITSPSGKIYIGESKNIEKRMYDYLTLTCNKQRKLYNSIKKYGWENHITEIIEECDFFKLLERERYWQDFYNVMDKNGLNLKLTGYNEVKFILSEESKNRISIKNSGINNGMYGKKHSEEKKIARRNYRHTEEAKEKIGIASRRGNNPLAKIVLNTNTGIFYMCVGDAADTINMRSHTLKQKLNERRKNNTDFIYA